MAPNFLSLARELRDTHKSSGYSHQPAAPKNPLDTLHFTHAITLTNIWLDPILQTNTLIRAEAMDTVARKFSFKLATSCYDGVIDIRGEPATFEDGYPELCNRIRHVHLDLLVANLRGPYVDKIVTGGYDEEFTRSAAREMFPRLQTVTFSGLQTSFEHRVKAIYDSEKFWSSQVMRELLRHFDNEGGGYEETSFSSTTTRYAAGEEMKDERDEKGRRLFRELKWAYPSEHKFLKNLEHLVL
ncbi:MAG: hypothetical protein M1831_003740 [Alyxoria varia]|nr:MAG: hypothetical protein M1831_003740 [Alyxoria varia]